MVMKVGSYDDDTNIESVHLRGFDVASKTKCNNIETTYIFATEMVDSEEQTGTFPTRRGIVRKRG